MGKASTRKHGQGAAPSDGVHERIRAEARRAREAPELGLVWEEKYPELTALLGAARAAAGAAVPAKFVYEGRPYWLRVSFGMVSVEVFDGPAVSEPVATGIGGGFARYGHAPGH